MCFKLFKDDQSFFLDAIEKNSLFYIIIMKFFFLLVSMQLWASDQSLPRYYLNELSKNMFVYNSQ